MTAYIKMIDIWMIITMLYPFSVVTLYSVMEFFKDDDLTTPAPFYPPAHSRSKKTIKITTFLLDFGLPVVVMIFIIFFWVLGIINTKTTSLHNTC